MEEDGFRIIKILLIQVVLEDANREGNQILKAVAISPLTIFAVNYLSLIYHRVYIRNIMKILNRVPVQ
jgi:hypothetical protein